MSYRPMLIGRALEQFDGLKDDPDAYHALMERLLRLVDAPWDAWPVYPDGEPEFRETQFGENGLLSFRVYDDAELLIIFNIVWAA
ncbi:hypothetical protein [Actinomadura sp. 6N118]|uniref:hypothetical protein n=1 Tax=Actinomadura sp. 6N118 TaxID=3375151 RepID=UPI0037953853